MSMRDRFIASCFFAACQLTAGTIELAATSATASWIGPVLGTVEFSISGPSLGVQGHGAFRGGPTFFPVGVPVVQACGPFADCMFQLQSDFGAPLVPECGVAGIPSGTCSGNASTFPSLIPSTDLIPATTNPTFTITAHLTGSYELCAPGVPDFVCFSQPQPVAVINVDLPGELTLYFNGPFPAGTGGGPPFEFIVFEEAQFVSNVPIPESSSLILLLIGSASFALAATLRRREARAAAYS